MYNLLLKELKLGVNPFFYVLPLLTGALMLIPGWLYLIVLLYFPFITIPNLFAGYRSQNDLFFSVLMPVTKKDIVKARLLTVVILELLHIVIAVIYGLIHIRIYPNLRYLFFSPTIGFWGIGFMMFGIFNLIMITMYYKTAYKFGPATIVSTVAAILFATLAEWLGIKNLFIYNLYKGTGADNLLLQITLLLIGIVIFAILNIITYKISIRLFEKVDI